MSRTVQSWPARPEHVSAARRAASEVASQAGAREAVLDAVRLAVSEAVSNAILHAYRNGSTGAFTVRAEAGGDELRVIVRDRGVGMGPRPDSPGAGLGLPLIASLADSVSVTAPHDGGTEVCMIWHLTG